MPTALTRITLSLAALTSANPARPAPAQPALATQPQPQPMNWLDRVESCLRHSLAVRFF